MTVIIRIYDPVTEVALVEVPAINAINFSYGLNASSQISGELPLNWPKMDLIDVGYPIAIFIENTRLISGFIQRFEPSLSDIVRFAAVGELDQLYREKPFPLAYYDNKPLLGVLVEILLQKGWVPGDISSLDNPDQVTTIDLRSEKNLLTQVNKLLGGVPEVFYREGSEILGYPSLDIGRFMQDSQIQALMPGQRSVSPADNPKIHWINDLSYQEDLENAVYALRSLGGNVQDTTGETRVINLGDALASDVNLLLDPDFPIIEDLAERGWACLNYRDFGRVGGRVLSTVDGAATAAIGDSVGGGVEGNTWVALTFVPYPGILESFSLWFGSVDASTAGFDLTWVLQEIDLTDYRTVLADNLLTGTISTTGLANTIYRVTPDTAYELEQGKLYGIALGFDFNPPADLFRVFIKRRAAPVSSSYAFKFQTRDGKASVGQLWGAANGLPFIELITRPIDAPLADFIGETAAKYAPKNTGANATAAEIEAAGAALYLWTKTYLIDHRPAIKTYSLSATGTKEFPKAGDTIFVNSKARGQYIDPLTGRIVPTIREVSADLRVDRVQADIEGDAVNLNYGLLSGTGVPKTDLITDLYDETENKAPAPGDVAARPWALLLDTLSTVVGPVSPDTTMEDGTLAVLVTLSIFSGSYASRPNDVEEVYLAGLPYGTISPGGELRVEMVQLPTIANTNVIFKIALRTRNWEYGDVATITVKQVWR